MTLPKVTELCLAAILEKATQQAPDKFAQDVMVELLHGQPALMEAVTTIMQPFLSTLAGNEVDGHELDESMRQEIMIMGQFCILGITLKALNAQIEAEEMNEVWS
tara:strand:- start:91 stop:405 length:315 start_codon:yes stop_codon:yes gene_type:complete